MTPDDAASLAPAVAALGSAGFAAALAASVSRAVAVDHVCLMRFASPGAPPVLESAVRRGGSRVGQVQHAYLAGLYRRDPVLGLPAEPGVRTLLLDGASIEDSAYRRLWQGPAGLVQRWSAVTAVAGQRVTLNLYRLRAGGPFSRSEYDWLEHMAPLLGALAAKQVEMAGVQLRSRERADRIEALGARLHATCGALTPRERAVLARVMLGMTSQGIAIDLSIGLASVLTYRKRGYARLGVTSQAELFALCW